MITVKEKEKKAGLIDPQIMESRKHRIVGSTSMRLHSITVTQIQ